MLYIVSMYMHVYHFQCIMKNCRLKFCTYIFAIKLVYRMIKDQFYRSINRFIVINSIPFHAYCIFSRKSEQRNEERVSERESKCQTYQTYQTSKHTHTNVRIKEPHFIFTLRNLQNNKSHPKFYIQTDIRKTTLKTLCQNTKLAFNLSFNKRWDKSYRNDTPCSTINRR